MTMSNRSLIMLADAHVETNLRRHAYPTFGDRRLSAIRPGEVQDWVARLTQVLSPATVQVNHGLVAALFKAAMRDRLVGSSPCEGTKLPKKLPKEVIPLTVGMVDMLAAGVPPRYRALVVLAAGTGLRQGECFGVADDRLDLTARTLRVDQQLILLPRRPPFLAPPKTPASHRTVPLPQVVVDGLAAHIERFPVHDPDRLVFTDEDGRALRRTAFSPRDLAPYRPRGGGAPRDRLSRTAPLLRLAAHPPRRVGQDRAAPARPRHRRGDPGYVRAPVA
jgi:integrase